MTDIYHSFHALQPHAQAQYLELACTVHPTTLAEYRQFKEKVSIDVKQTQQLTHVADVVKLCGIFDTNFYGLDCSGGEGIDGNRRKAAGVFFEASRINHSCIPNATSQWEPSLQSLTVHAIEDIAAGEEITISYVEALRKREERQQSLKGRYNFDCDCPACDSTTVFGQMSDRSRGEADQLGRILMASKVGTEGLVRSTMGVLQLIQEECLGGIWETHARAALTQALAHQGRMVEAVAELMKVMQCTRVCCGEDGRVYLEPKEKVDQIRRILAGSRDGTA
ncbi:hypothetical protein B0A50_05351 [Salinomyces thailandicus]|uniref:SET domain-containing protein n=1 Tax=Salinomyces thailandicus TaxID=706561 RepID=A0A4U0TW53_9PEZI|nr:hypothetical protein B0A50_05351 [Salinomyces thailandica]